MTLSLDTNVLIELMRARSRDLMRAFALARAAEMPMMVSVVVVHELISGALRGQRPDAEMEKVHRLLSLVKIAAFDLQDAVSSGHVRATLKDQGRSIGDIDTLIAGQAMAGGWTVVTSNIKHFGRIAGLPLIDWSVGPGHLTTDEIALRAATP